MTRPDGRKARVMLVLAGILSGMVSAAVVQAQAAAPVAITG